MQLPETSAEEIKEKHDGDMQKSQAEIRIRQSRGGKGVPGVLV